MESWVLSYDLDEVSEELLTDLVQALNRTQIHTSCWHKPMADPFQGQVTIYCQKPNGDLVCQEDSFRELQKTVDGLVADRLGWSRQEVAGRRYQWDYSGPWPSVP